MAINIGLHGAFGKMGKAITKSIAKEPGQFKLAKTFSRSNKPSQLIDFCSSVDLIVDFSSPLAIPNLLKAAIDVKKKIVMGTTGLSSNHVNLIKKASSYIPILYAPNTSIGANILIEVAGKISKNLKDYDVEIIDIHHRNKKDAPSGTALAIGENIAKNRQDKFEDVALLSKNNKNTRKTRKKEDIGFSSLRAGSICGKHEVIFAGNNEIINISAEATTRGVFAEGALFAAKWLYSKTEPRLYSMQDVLNF